MKKIVSIVLLCALLLVCFSGCSITNNTNDEKKQNQDTTNNTNNDKEQNQDKVPDGNNDINNSDQVSEAYSVALNEFITKMQKEANDFEKIEFFIEYQDLHFQLKESGKYNDEKWSEPTIIVTIDCNYDLAADEDWYKACSNKDIKTLNTAFFNEYSNELSEGHFTPWGIAPALYFEYDHSESTLSETLNVFYSDYSVLKQLIDLEYVTDIFIQYFYSVPGSYFDE